MCGRFALTLPVDAMAQLFAAQPANDLPDIPDHNICPTNRIATIHLAAGARRLVAMRWGFLPSWYKTATSGPTLINARAETLADKPVFADAARHRRCLIPATGYYEWTDGQDGTRLPWFISPSQAECIAMAGIWQVWGPPEAPQATCAIVTRSAGEGLVHLHHRQPVMIARQNWALWLGQEGHGAARLLSETPEVPLRTWRVSSLVNSVRASGAELSVPLT